MPASGFLHDHPNFVDLLRQLAQQTGIATYLIEKDYWLMHGLWVLQQQGWQFQLKGGTSLSKGFGIIQRFSEDIDLRIEPPAEQQVKAGKNQDKPAHIETRRQYFDWLAAQIRTRPLPGFESVERDTEYDDPKYRGAGIRLHYPVRTDYLPGIKEGILLEVGFDDTAPNTPCLISAWALDAALASPVQVIDNRAVDVPCYSPAMNKAKLKTYAPQARKDFIAAVTQRANLLGLSESAGKFEALPAERQGDVVLIAGREWPARVMPSSASAWCAASSATALPTPWRRWPTPGSTASPRCASWSCTTTSATATACSPAPPPAACRTSSPTRPTSPPAANCPVWMPILIAELKLAGNKDGELYRLLLVAQCNALTAAMPFLFERIDDETELLLPDNLLRTDSVIAKLVAEIPEEDWAEVEIIGWLYQFYISEKKDQVIGKVVKSEDIPAATQLFTPNWIVQYLVQNSVGRLWLMANPTSTLKSRVALLHRARRADPRGAGPARRPHPDPHGARTAAA
jgi:hypothetical protein